MVGTTPGLKKEEGKKGLLTDMANSIVAEEWCSGGQIFRGSFKVSLLLDTNSRFDISFKPTKMKQKI